MADSQLVLLAQIVYYFPFRNLIKNSGGSIEKSWYTASPKRKLSTNGPTLYDRAITAKSLKERKTKNRQRELAVKEMTGVTFTPELSGVSRKIMNRKPKVAVENRLLGHVAVVRAKKEKIVGSVLEDHMGKCTFIPKINQTY